MFSIKPGFSYAFRMYEYILDFTKESFGTVKCKPSAAMPDEQVGLYYMLFLLASTKIV